MMIIKSFGNALQLEPKKLWRTAACATAFWVPLEGEGWGYRLLYFF